MSQLYFLNCSIKDLKIAEKAIHDLYQEVKIASNGDYKVIGAAGNNGTFSIAFISPLSQEILRERFEASAIHGVNYLLLQAEQLIAGHIEQGVAQWFSRHRKILKKSTPK